MGRLYRLIALTNSLLMRNTLYQKTWKRYRKNKKLNYLVFLKRQNTLPLTSNVPPQIRQNTKLPWLPHLTEQDKKMRLLLSPRNNNNPRRNLNPRSRAVLVTIGSRLFWLS